MRFQLLLLVASAVLLGVTAAEFVAPDGNAGEGPETESTSTSEATTTETSTAATAAAETSTSTDTSTDTTTESTTEAITTLGVNRTQFSVTCDTDSCTYQMDVPGLDVETYGKLTGQLVSDVTELDYEKYTKVPTLQAQADVEIATVGGLLDDLEATVDGLSTQIGTLKSSSETLGDNVKAADINLANAENQIKILKETGRSTCYYRKCLADPTTKAPTTTPTTPPTTTPNVCDREQPCKNGGTCRLYYNSYQCDCGPGNRDGTQLDCTTSLCQQSPLVVTAGEFVSPGYFDETNQTSYNSSASCAWIVQPSANKYLQVDTTEGALFNLALDPSAVLQLQVGTSKLKLTNKTTVAMINFILNNKKSPTTVTLTTGAVPTDGNYFFNWKFLEAPQESP